MVNQSHNEVSAAEETLGAQKGKGIKLRHALSVALGEDFCVLLLVLPLTHNRIRTRRFYFYSLS